MENHSLNYSSNRKRLKAFLPDSLIYLKGREEVIRTGDCYYPFRQFSNFLYLSGVSLPGCSCLLTPKEDYLFIPDKNMNHKIWIGRDSSLAEFKKDFGFSHVFYSQDFNKIFDSCSKRYPLCYTEKGLKKEIKRKNPSVEVKVAEFLRALSLLRSQKTEAELKMMKEAARISALAHNKAMQSVRPGLYEFQLQSIYESELFFNNLRHTAFPTICAGGINSSILHYSSNNAQLKAKNLCLLDAGGEYQGYAADFTRTFPVSKKFSPRQKRIYNLVLSAQEDVLKAIHSGVLISDLQKICIDRLLEGLKDFGFIKGQSEDTFQHKTCRLFYPHGISHMLGLDTHDVSFKEKKVPSADVRADITLKENYVITVEPGLYFNPYVLTDKTIRKQHRDFIHWDKVDSFLDFGGIRIEDNVVVTTEGCLNLTSVPKTIQAIEELKA